MSNFKILFPDIPFNSTILASSTLEDLSSVYDCITGSRRKFVQFNSNGTSRRIDFDLGSGITQTPDYLLITNLDFVTDSDSADITVTLYGNTSQSEAGALSQAFSSIGTSDLVGIDQSDFVTSVSLGGARRWHLIKIATTQSLKYWVGKIYLGNAFNFDYEPTFCEIEKSLKIADRKEKRIAKLKFEGVAGSKKGEFENKIEKYKDVNPIFLWDTDNQFLNDRSLFYGYLTNVKYSHNNREIWTIEIEVHEIR